MTDGTFKFVSQPAQTANIDWKRVAAGCPVCQGKIQYHTLTAWCLNCGWAMNWETKATTVLATKETFRELTHGMPTVAEDAAELRLLDLALAYALDTQEIHMNDVEKINRLRNMHVRVLRWFREDV